MSDINFLPLPKEAEMCPVCGERPEFYFEHIDKFQIDWVIRCKNCDLKEIENNEKRVVYMWNEYIVKKYREKNIYRKKLMILLEYLGVTDTEGLVDENTKEFENTIVNIGW